MCGLIGQSVGLGARQVQVSRDYFLLWVGSIHHLSSSSRFGFRSAVVIYVVVSGTDISRAE